VILVWWLTCVEGKHRHCAQTMEFFVTPPLFGPDHEQISSFELQVLDIGLLISYGQDLPVFFAVPWSTSTK
jgi:hypothetical protein